MMNIKRIVEIEQNNINCIFLHRDSADDSCKAYEFSAYLVSKFITSLKMEEEPAMDVHDMLYVVKADMQKIMDFFASFGIEKSEGCIKISLYDFTHTMQWKNDFALLKEQQREKHSKLGDFVLGISRLGKVE